MPSTSKPTLVGAAALVASLAMLAGCGSSGGGGGGTATSAGGADTFDGSKSEALGYWCLKVTSATGFYADDHIAPVGITVGCGLQISSSNLQFFYDSEPVSGTGSYLNLTPDATAKAYKATGVVTTVGTGTYYGPRQGQTITEDWTVTPLSTGARLTISGTASGGGTGTVTADLVAIPGYIDNNLSTDWYGYGSKSDEPLYANSTQVVELEDWNPGTYAYLYWDAGNPWDEYLYVDMFYRDASGLHGGGWYDGGKDTGIATYGTVDIPLDSSDHPVGMTIHLTQGFSSGTVTHPTITGGHYTNENALNLMYDPDNYNHAYTLTVGTVTSGGELESNFGVATTVHAGGFTSRGYATRFANWNSGQWIYYGNNQSGTQRSSVVYSNWGYHNSSPSYPSYDLDASATTQERATVSLTYSADTGEPTGGTIVLQVYDLAGALQSTETMTFTLTY